MTNRMEERYEGAFLDALDLPEGKLVPVTIEHIAEPFAEKDSAGKAIKSAILSFKGKTKRLVLNKTNFKNLKAMFGRNPADWIGKTISIQRRYLDAAHGFGQNNTLAIRIIPPPGTPILKSAANFMGSATPYTDGRKRQPEPPPDEAPAGVREWATAIKVLQSPGAIAEFRASVLPTCPAELMAMVEDILHSHELTIANQ